MTISREQFHNDLGDMVWELERRSLDYRAIGSVAMALHGIAPVDLAARDAVDEIDKRPDLDIILPRAELVGAREVRELFARRESPMKLGLAIPSMQVDLHPDAVDSRLTWGRHSLDIPTDVFTATDGRVGDVMVRSIPPETLRHFYSSMSPKGAGGEKYRQKLDKFDAALGADVPHEPDDSLGVFHEYANLMQQHDPISRQSMELFHRLTAGMTLEQRNRMRHVAFKLADLAGWR